MYLNTRQCKYEITRHSVSEEIRTVKMWTVLYNTKYVFKNMNRNVWITYYILNGYLLYFYRKQFKKSLNVLAWHSDFHRSIPTLWCWHQHYVNATNLFQFKYNKSMLLYVLSVKLRKIVHELQKRMIKILLLRLPKLLYLPESPYRYDHVINNKSWTPKLPKTKSKIKVLKSSIFLLQAILF